jgi:hypothetical protein
VASRSREKGGESSCLLERAFGQPLRGARCHHVRHERLPPPTHMHGIAVASSQCVHGKLSLPVNPG